MNWSKGKKIGAAVVISSILFTSGLLAGRTLAGARTQPEETKKEVFGKTNFRELTVYDTDGEACVFEEKTEKISIIVYEKAGCGACIKELPQVQRIMEVLSPVIDVKIIWEGAIPYQNVEKNKIEKSRNYQMPKNLMLDLSSPTYYVLDKNNEIALKSAEPKDIIRFAVGTLDEAEKQTLKTAAAEYINNRYFEENMEKSKILYFTMEGCKDCKTVEPLVERLEKTYHLEKIHTESSIKKECEKDYGYLLATVFELDWYPSFLIINGSQYEFVGKTEKDMLESKIVGIAEALK